MKIQKKTKRERKREREKGGKRERGKEREMCMVTLFLFLKGMTGALAPFSYLVNIMFPEFNTL
jgi:hypothetical protein